MSRVDAERLNARRVLASVLAMVLTVFGIQLVSAVIGADAFGQTAPSPGPTSTGPTIEFLNPDDDTSTEISDKFDVDNAYHLNAFVNEVPVNPAVEFEIQNTSSTNAEITNIGLADRVGNDTFELFWQTPLNSLEDGEFILRAILFSGGNEVDRDEETVLINRESPASPLDDPEPGPAETVEITSPENGETLGFFTDASGTSRIIIEGVPSVAGSTPDPDSPGTNFIRGFYSLTPPGDEPEWTDCGFQRSSSDDDATTTRRETRVRCTLTSGQNPRFITAVALVANDTPPTRAGPSASFDDSGDAHRVFAELQNPTSVLVSNQGSGANPQNTQDVAVGDCANFVADILDQNGAPFAGANVDVHAQGPSDQLRFDTGSDDSDANQPPDQGHAQEIAFNCDDDETGGLQGERNILGGSDVKHIETTGVGSDRNGRFSFGVRSDVRGVTQITAFADENGDDQQCSLEASGNAAVDN